MKILIAPDSFKESLPAREVCDIIARGLKQAGGSRFAITKAPLADGGEGTLAVLVAGAKGTLARRRVTGPLGGKVNACYGLLDAGKTAVVEMAQASGLALVPPARRDPRKTTTRGTGELIANALAHGCRKVIVAAGGSATVDGGSGMARALGARFLDARGRDAGSGGGVLARIRAADLSGFDRRVKKTEFIIASDVTSPLLGEHGAARVFGPQKGASPAAVEELERGMANFARLLRECAGRDVSALPGAGAAGGLGAGLMAFCGARAVSGIGMVMELLGLERMIREADLVITGEGRIDGQTLRGKTISGVLRLTRKHRVPAVCIAGSVLPGARPLYGKGVIGLLDIIPAPVRLEDALAHAEEYLFSAALNLGYLLKGLPVP